MKIRYDAGEESIVVRFRTDSKEALGAKGLSFGRKGSPRLSIIHLLEVEGRSVR